MIRADTIFDLQPLFKCLNKKAQREREKGIGNLIPFRILPCYSSFVLFFSFYQVPMGSDDVAVRLTQGIRHWNWRKNSTQITT